MDMFTRVLLIITRGGGGVLNKVLSGEAPPGVIFRRKGVTPCRIPSIDKWYPFHIQSLVFHIPFNP